MLRVFQPMCSLGLFLLQVDHCTYWDNNSGTNYTIILQPQAQMLSEAHIPADKMQAVKSILSPRRFSSAPVARE